MDERTARAAFARTIRTARGGRSQLALGVRTGIAQTTWARWERGEGSPTAARLPEIADALGVPLADLLGHWLHEMETGAEDGRAAA